MEGQRTRVQFPAQAGSLEQAYAVFAAHRAAEVDRGVDALVERRRRTAPSPRGVPITGCRLPSPAWAAVTMRTSCRAAVASMRAIISCFQFAPASTETYRPDVVAA